MKRNILIFGGTTEGRALCEAFSGQGREATVCTATAYGGRLVDDLPHITVRSGRMDTSAMAAFITQGAFEIIVDATHPYAREATRAIREACAATGCAYIRVLRDNRDGGKGASGPHDSELPRIVSVPDMDAAVDYLATTSGAVLLATGSKELARFCRLPGFSERLYARVLPDSGVIAQCEALGFRGAHIIAMQGPFSHALNVALLKQLGCVFMVSKDTGGAGGLDEKISAAHEAGATLVLVERPEQETGSSLAETLKLLELDTKEDS